MFVTVKDCAAVPSDVHAACDYMTVPMSFLAVPDVVCKINSFTPEEAKSLSMSMESGENDRWWDQVQLTKLILAFNSLRIIPASIQDLSSLNVLDVSCIFYFSYLLHCILHLWTSSLPVLFLQAS